MRRSALPLALCALAALAFSPVAAMRVPDDEKRDIDTWVLSNDLDEVGNPRGTMYTGGTPLFDESSGRRVDRYEYIVRAHPDRPWKTQTRYGDAEHQFGTAFRRCRLFRRRRRRKSGRSVPESLGTRTRGADPGLQGAPRWVRVRKLDAGSVDRAEHGERRGGGRAGARARRLATPMRTLRFFDVDRRASSEALSEPIDPHVVRQTTNAGHKTR